MNRRSAAVSEVKQERKVIAPDDAGGGDLPPFDDAVAAKTYETLCSQCHDLADVDAFVTEVRAFKIGDPTSADTYIGPLTRAAQLDVVAAQVSDAVAKGGKLLVGGKRVDGPGNYFEPTVVVDATHDMLLMKEESFGPVIGLMKVKDDEQALALMNDSEYGLTAAPTGTAATA